MTDRELMQQALDVINCECGFGGSNDYDPWSIAAALRERLSHPEQEPVAWVYPQALEAFKKGNPWVAYGSNGDGPHCDGIQRIPLYLNDAVAPTAEPRESGSGAGFESLPASPTWWHEPGAKMNYRKWQGLTDEEREQFRQWAHPDIIEAIELRLQERNT